jgi:hypothetical protein
MFARGAVHVGETWFNKLINDTSADREGCVAEGGKRTRVWRQLRFRVTELSLYVVNILNVTELINKLAVESGSVHRVLSS